MLSASSNCAPGVILARSQTVAAAFALSLLVACTSGGSAGDGSSEPAAAQDINANRDIVSSEDSFVFRDSSPFKPVLKECVLIRTTAESCPVSTLPFIGDGVNTPVINDIMDRLIVSHSWMGTRFEEVLQQASPELLDLFSSATAIMIGSDVRPSFYTSLTGAIYLDPFYLWLSAEEKLAVTLAEDFRSSFGSDLNFLVFSSWRKGFDRAYTFYSLEDDSSRPFGDMVELLTSLLFHELAHANDFVPKATIPDLLQSGLTVFEAIDSNSDNWLSVQMQDVLPLISDEMKNFANVRYRGADASDAQKLADPAHIGALIGGDGASSFYSYTTIREDMANLVEEVLMAKTFGISRTLATVNRLSDPDNQTCSDIIVSWGQRNRIADPMVLPRAKLAIEYVLGDAPEVMAFLDNELLAAEHLAVGVDWCTNLLDPARLASAPTVRSKQIMPSAKDVQEQALLNERTHSLD